MKNPIFIPFFIFVVIFSQAANGQVGIQQQVQIDEQTAAYRQKIEDYYSNRLAELRLRMQTQIRLLEIAEAPKPNLITLSEWTQFVEAVLTINGCDDKLSGRYYYAKKTTSDKLAGALIRIAERKSDLLNKFEWEAVRLLNQKEYALTEGLKEYQQKLNRGETIEQPEATFGVVAGILYAQEDSTALIDAEIVREGQIIHGVKIVRIYKDKVEFERNGEMWTQKVQQRVQARWR